MDHLTPEQRKKNMKSVKNKGTDIEILLAKSMWKAGIRYRKNNKKVFGVPDFTISKAKIAIFCDDEFWHGKDWETQKNTIKSNQDFWIPKLEKNIQRDIFVNQRLEEEDWTVMRFWGNDIKKEREIIIDKIIRKYEQIIYEKN